MRIDNILVYNEELEREVIEDDFPWVEFSIDGKKYDVNSKYLYGPYDD